MTNTEGTMTREITNYDDTIDSREIIARLAELEEIAANGDSLLDQNERIELSALRKFNDEAPAIDDWHYGATLIRDSYFVEYAQELAEDIGAIDSNAQWPNTCIDWEQAARELQMDYTPVEFDGVTYWVR